MLGTVVENITSFFQNIATSIGIDVVFFVALAVEALLVLFFLVKSLFSYEASLNRALEKINVWLFERKIVTEDNIKELNFLFKEKSPKRLCYFWQQYILFREGAPSYYLSTENLIEKPLKTSSYNSNIKNLTMVTSLWATFVALMVLVCSTSASIASLDILSIGAAICVPVIVVLIGMVFIIFLRARKNATLNSLYQNVSLFGRFMDNACIDLPSYIDYQLLFTPQEIENGQPVLREFLDYKARKEKEEFNKAREESFQTEEYDFSSTGVDGSIVLDRAMAESERFLKKKEKILLKISQFESELDTRRKNFDNVQKDYQTKIQASKENVDRLRQMQEETTNRIESNYYRKQQTQEIAKQEQYEQEFEQQRAKYMLEKNEGEEEIAKLNAELEADKNEVENAMKSEYQTFFNKFCKSAEKVLAKVFDDRLSELKTENESNKETITQLQIQMKNRPDNEVEQGNYDAEGNYVYADGTYYDKFGNFHDKEGNIYSQDGKLISKAEDEREKQVVNFDDFNAFDFLTDISQKDDIYSVAEDVVKDVDNSIEVINNSRPSIEEPKKVESVEMQVPVEESQPETMEEKVEATPSVTSEPEKPKKKAGRPRKIVTATTKEPAKKRGRPKKVSGSQTSEKKRVGRPKKTTETAAKTQASQRKAGRPKKIVKEEPETKDVKRGRGRPKKVSIEDINKRLLEEEIRINELRSSLNKDLEKAMDGMNGNTLDASVVHRDELIKEIERLQEEAKQVIAQNESDNKIAEINSKLEGLLEQVKKLN